MSYVLAFLGFAALVILHEAGHFAAAKAVGMRVERFSLFFGPLLVKVRRGETEYGIGPIPLGGYVKISGMNPREELPPDVMPRAYFRQPVWKRIVVISAGPAVNLLLAFVIIAGVRLHTGVPVGTAKVADVQRGAPAAAVLRRGDRLLAVDGVRGDPDTLRRQIGSHRCAGPPRAGCRSATPARVEVQRGGKTVTFSIRGRYDADPKARRVLLGFAFLEDFRPTGVGGASRQAVNDMWTVTSLTVGAVVRIFQPEERKKLSSVVGGYKTTQESFATSTSQAFFILGLISLSLAIINLFPFLPLDGGHIFWALAEKVRRKPIPFSVMERASVVGFALVMLVFFIGLSNDIGRLQNGGFKVR